MAWPISDKAVALVKEFEGGALLAYRDPVGVLTIGYGYTNRAGYGPGVDEGDVWTAEQAEAMLREGLERFAAGIQPHFTRKPNPDQFGAFVSLAYNIGQGAFVKSTALRRWNAGDVEGAAEALQWFNKAGGKVLRGLVRRRAAEAELLLSKPVGQYEHPPSPAPAKPPRRSVIEALMDALVSMIKGQGK